MGHNDTNSINDKPCQGGAFPLSSDVLSKQKNGLWAIEIDESLAPRMYADDVMLDLLGMSGDATPEEIYAAWFNSIDQNAYGTVSEAVEKMIAGENAEVQYPWHHPDGTVRTVRCGGIRNFEYTSGLRIEGTHRDITGTIHYDDERTRRDSFVIERYLQSSLGAFMINLTSGKISKMKANVASEDIAPIIEAGDYTEFLKLYVEAYVVPADKEKVLTLTSLEECKRHLVETEQFSVKYRRKHVDTPRWYAMHVARISNNEAFINFEDCTKEVLNTAFWGALSSQMISGYIIDVETQMIYEVKKSPVIDISKTADYNSLEEMIKRSKAIIDEEYYPGWLEFTKTENLLSIYHEKRHADYVYSSHVTGQLRWVRASIYSLDTEAPYLALRYSLFTKEHLERMKREEALNKALNDVRLAEEASRLKTMFVQNISHDIRTPLNAIVGFSQLLALPDGFLSEEEKSQYCEYVKDSTDLLTMIINDVLCMSDVEKGILNINKYDAQCNDIMRKSVNCSASRTPQGVRMHYTSEVDNAFTINTDPKRVEQILVNFLSNACKHTSVGEILVHCSVFENPGYVTFSVTDTGEGVNPALAEDIFNRFVTFDSMKDGHGMGLSICRDLADKLGGMVRLDRTYTRGARFVLLLPIKGKALMSAEDLEILKNSLKGDWEYLADEVFLIGNIKPEWSSTESFFRGFTIHDDLTVTARVAMPDGTLYTAPVKFSFSVDGSFTFGFFDGFNMYISNKRNIKVRDGKLFMRFERKNFDGLVLIPEEILDIPWDYCRTTFTRR